MISHKKTLAGNAFYKEALQYAHALLSEGARRSVCIICVGADNNHKNWCDLTLGNIINTHGHNSVLFHNHNKQEKTIPAWLAKHLSTGHTSLIVLSADEVDTDWVKKYIPATSANYMTDVHMLSCLQNSHPTKENHLYAA